MTGLVSVTFRKLPPNEIIRLTKDAGLEGIEWGSDIHCPPDDLHIAKHIAGLMSSNGLTVISYGSYYRAGTFGQFDNILRTAVTLQTSNIRIWAGEISSAEAGEDVYINVINDTVRIADMAAKHGISISYEYHSGTLTDNLCSTVRLLNSAGRNNVYSYWQPRPDLSDADNLDSLKQLAAMKKLKNIHVFSWMGKERMPLDFYEDKWREYIKIADSSKTAICFLLEFVKNDNPEMFIEDAKFLKSLTRR